MTSFDTIYSINPKNFALKHKDVTSDWENLICENEGSFASDCQYMAFDCNGVEVVVDFDLSVLGQVSYDRGDYWTPPSTDVEITDVDVTITSFHIDEWEVELSDDLKKTLTEVVKNNL